MVDAEDHVGGGAVLARDVVDRERQAQVLRVGDLVGGDQLRAERVERLAALALVPLAAALELELALRDVVREHVAGHVVARLGGGAEVARRTADDDAELDLPVGLGRADGTSTRSKGPTTVLGSFMKTIGSSGIAAPVSAAWSR